MAGDPVGTAPTTAISSSATPQVANTTQAAADPYWFEQIPKQGIAAFNPNPAGYKVFRNVKDYGARGKCQCVFDILFR